MTERNRVRILVELRADSPIFQCLTDDDDVAAEEIYWRWLRPIIATQIGGARIVELETESSHLDPDYPNFLPWGEP